MKTITLSLILALTLLCTACEKYPTTSKYKYIYTDENGVCHITPQCESIKNSPDYDNYAVRRQEVQSTSLHTIRNLPFCTSCVSDKLYEELTH